MNNAALQIGLSAWIIQDGNYADFGCGTVARFALEFYSKGELSSGAGDRHLVHHDDALYQAHGIVRYCARDVWVVDFGPVSAFREQEPPPGIAPGVSVSGEVWLGVDPFFYFERLCKHTGIPPLIYEWQIDGIAMETAPFVETANEFGRKYRVRDQSLLRRVPIARTDAWKDDNGMADYLLTCRRTDSSPSKSLR